MKKKSGITSFLREPSEAEIEDLILSWLNFQYQCFAFKLNLKGTWDPKRKIFTSAPKWVPKGGADIIFSAHGKFGCFEVKTPQEYKKFFSSPGDHELRQQAFLAKIKSTLGFAEVVCSLQQVQEYYGKWMTP